jgi:hypothetical protein
MMSFSNNNNNTNSYNTGTMSDLHSGNNMNGAFDYWAGSVDGVMGDLLSFDGGYSEIDALSADDIMMSNFQNELVFRSATLLAPAPAPESFEAHLGEPREYILEKPALKRRPTAPSATFHLDSAANYSPDESLTGIQVPEIPLLLMPTHFEVDRSLDQIISGVNEVLSLTAGVSFEFNFSAHEVSEYLLVLWDTTS